MYILVPLWSVFRVVVPAYVLYLAAIDNWDDVSSMHPMLVWLLFVSGGYVLAQNSLRLVKVMHGFSFLHCVHIFAVDHRIVASRLPLGLWTFFKSASPSSAMLLFQRRK